MMKRLTSAVQLSFLAFIHLDIVLGSTAAPSVMDAAKKTTSYTYVPGFFAQDNLTATGIPAVPPRFGLLDDSAHRWPKLFAEVEKLNHHAERGVSYKFFLLGRHGEGYHNVGEAKYGTPAWDSYWSKLDGDGEITWGPDAELTALGQSQAEVASAAWKTELAAHLPLPGRLYSSPLTRAIQTYNITFDGIIPKHHTAPEILEFCREQYGEHTCDLRRTKTYLRTTFPHFNIEHGFAETDPLWEADVREPSEHVASRAHSVLDRIFEHDKDEIFISITAHSGYINGFLNATGRPNYSLPTGGVLPMVVKATVKH